MMSDDAFIKELRDRAEVAAATHGELCRELARTTMRAERLKKYIDDLKSFVKEHSPNDTGREG